MESELSGKNINYYVIHSFSKRKGLNLLKMIKPLLWYNFIGDKDILENEYVKCLYVNKIEIYTIDLYLRSIKEFLF